MRKHLIAFASLAALSTLPTMAFAQGEGAATGAAAGAITGGVIGGPVGAAVGAGVGAAAGAVGESASRPNTTGTVVVPSGTTVVTPAPEVRERTTTCVQGARSETCTETEVRR